MCSKTSFYEKHYSSMYYIHQKSPKKKHITLDSTSNCPIIYGVFNYFNTRFFPLSVLKTKLVRAKLDQANETVVVSSTMHRTFTQAHWKNLHGLLAGWRDRLKGIREQINQAAQAQVEMVRQQRQAAITGVAPAAAAAAVAPSS